MSNKLWRVVRACVELGHQNPIQQIHDQGAGGNCNVVKEIIYPLGAEIDIRAIKLGDQTMSVLEIWGAEYQENDALLIKPEARDMLEEICKRERCNMQVSVIRKIKAVFETYDCVFTLRFTDSWCPVCRKNYKPCQTGVGLIVSLQFIAYLLSLLAQLHQHVCQCGNCTACKAASCVVIQAGFSKYIWC